MSAGMTLFLERAAHSFLCLVCLLCASRGCGSQTAFNPNLGKRVLLFRTSHQHLPPQSMFLPTSLARPSCPDIHRPLVAAAHGSTFVSRSRDATSHALCGCCVRVQLRLRLGLGFGVRVRVRGVTHFTNAQPGVHAHTVSFVQEIGVHAA
jgi:hypothetical protein